MYCVHDLSEKLSQYDCRVQRADDESWNNLVVVCNDLVVVLDNLVLVCGNHFVDWDN